MCYALEMEIAKTQGAPAPSSDLTEPTNATERGRLLVEAEADIKAGYGTPGTEVASWLLDLTAGRHASPPCDR